MIRSFDLLHQIGIAATTGILCWGLGASMGFELGERQHEAVRADEINTRAKALLRQHCRGWYSVRPRDTKPPILVCFGLELKDKP